MSIIFTVLFALARGMREGIVMHLPGPREHVAFYMYHLLDVTMLIGFGCLLTWLMQIKPRRLFIFGLLLLAWECTEVGYSLSRWGTLVAYEHVVMADLFSFYICGPAVWVWHGIRLTAAIAILHRGSRR